MDFRESALCQTTPNSTKQATNTTRRLTEGFAQNSRSIQAQTFVSTTAKITASATCLLTITMETMHTSNGNTQRPFPTRLKKGSQMRAAQTLRATSWITSEMTRGGTYNSTNPGQPCASEPVNRGFCLLHSWRAGECSKQYYWKRRPIKGSAERISSSSGGRNQNTRYFKERSVVSDGGG